MRITADCARQTGAHFILQLNSGAIGNIFIAYYRRLRPTENKKIFFKFFSKIRAIFMEKDDFAPK